MLRIRKTSPTSPIPHCIPRTFLRLASSFSDLTIGPPAPSLEKRFVHHLTCFNHHFVFIPCNNIVTYLLIGYHDLWFYQEFGICPRLRGNQTEGRRQSGLCPRTPWVQDQRRNSGLLILGCFVDYHLGYTILYFEVQVQ